MDQARRKAEKRARREWRLRKKRRSRAPASAKGFEALEPWEQMMLIHFPEGEPFSCAQCEDFRTGACEGEGREGFEAVKACMMAKQGEIGVF